MSHTKRLCTPNRSYTRRGPRAARRQLRFINVYKQWRRPIDAAQDRRAPAAHEPDCPPKRFGVQSPTRNDAERARGLWQWIVRSVLVVVLCLSPLAAAHAQDTPEPTPSPIDAPITFRTWVEPKEVTIGDPIRYSVEIKAPEGTELVIPVLSGALGDFTITDFGDVPPTRKDGWVTITRWYTLTCFETGDQLVPKPKVRYRLPGDEQREAEGEETLVGVKSLLEHSPDAKDIRDIKPPEELPFDWRPYGLVAAVFAAVALAGWGFFYFLNRPRRQYAPPPRPPHELALAALNKLHAQRLVDEGKFAEYYVQLSAIIRGYLEDGFGVRAPEMTTEEFLAAATADRRLAAAQRRLLGDFLSQADLVKFARHLPTLNDTQSAYEAARRFVEETRPQGQSQQAEVTRAVA